MEKPNKLSNLELVLTQLTLEAKAKAENAWAKAKKDGQIGNMPLPEDPHNLLWLERGFKMGYGLALTDHTMDATRKLREAGERDEEKRMRRFPC